MATDPAESEPAWIKQEIETIKARIRALDECDRKLTIALLTGRDADVTPSPDAAGTRLHAQAVSGT